MKNQIISYLSIISVIGLNAGAFAAEQHPKFNPPYGSAHGPVFDTELMKKLLKRVEKMAEENRNDSAAAPKPTSLPKPQAAAKPAAKNDADQKKDADVKARHDTGKIKKFKNLEELQQYYKDELRKEEQGLMEIFYSCQPITEQQWKDAVNLSYREQASIPPTRKRYSPNSKIYKMACSCLRQEGFDPSTVDILHDDDPDREHQAHYLAATVRGLVINEARCSQMSEDLFYALLIHEIEHLRRRDSATKPVLQSLIWESQEFIKLWNHFVERRADTMAFMVNPMYTKAFIQFLKTSNHPSHHFKEEIEHPSDANRVALAERIYTEMMACLQ